MVLIETEYDDIHEFRYGELYILDDAVVEVNIIDGEETDQTGELARVAATDGERYAFSGPLDRESDESIKEGLQEANRMLSRGNGFELGAKDHTTARYLEERV